MVDECSGLLCVFCPDSRSVENLLIKELYTPSNLEWGLAGSDRNLEPPESEYCLVVLDRTVRCNYMLNLQVIQVQ